MQSRLRSETDLKSATSCRAANKGAYSAALATYLHSGRLERSNGGLVRTKDKCSIGRTSRQHPRAEADGDTVRLELGFGFELGLRVSGKGRQVSSLEGSPQFRTWS